MTGILKLVFLFGFVQAEAPATVESVDLQRYAGRWFELASIPQSFSEDCVKNTTAEYTVDGEEVSVVNSCQTGEDEYQAAEGRARINPETQSSAKLQVTFVKFVDWVWAFAGDYWVLALDENYQWSVVGHPTREYLWILSREPVMSLEQLLELRSFVESVGYDSCLVNMTLNDQNQGLYDGLRLCDLKLP